MAKNGEEKSTGELVKELEKVVISSKPENTEKKPLEKKEETKPTANPPSIAISVPLSEQSPQNFDGIISKILVQKYKQIDDEATAKKKEIEEKLVNSFSILVDSIINNSSIPIPPQPQTSSAKDNSEALRLINAEIEKREKINMKNKNLPLLYNLRDQLGGHPISESSSAKSKKHFWQK